MVPAFAGMRMKDKKKMMRLPRPDKSGRGNDRGMDSSKG